MRNKSKPKNIERRKINENLFLKVVEAINKSGKKKTSIDEGESKRKEE